MEVVVEISNILARGVVSTALAFLSIGCVAQADESDAPANEDGEELGEWAEALGELSCATNSEFDVYSACKPSPALGSTCSHTSPNSDYGWVAGECPGQWNVRWYLTPLAGSQTTVRHSVEWAGTPLTTESLCLSARMTVAGYYWNQATGSKSLAGTASSKGSWSGGVCTFVPDGSPHTYVSDVLTCTGGVGTCQQVWSTAGKAWRTNFPLGISERVRVRVTTTLD